LLEFFSPFTGPKFAKKDLISKTQPQVLQNPIGDAGGAGAREGE
jgi:hypothetical protein